MTCIGIEVLSNCLGIRINSIYLIPIVFTVIAIIYLFVRSLPIISPIVSAMFGFYDVIAIIITGILLWLGVYYGLKFVDWIKDPMNAALIGAGIIVFSVFLYVLKQPEKKKKTRRIK